MEKISAKKLVLIALFTALTMIFTAFIRVPLPLGYVNLGDAFVFLSVFVLGPYGIIAAALGSCLADCIGYIVYAPGTLIIKGIMAFVAWWIHKVLFQNSKKRIFAEIAGGVVGAIIMTAGYFFYEWAFFATAAVAIANAPWTLLQGAIGVVISVGVMRVLVATKILDKMKRE